MTKSSLRQNHAIIEDIFSEDLFNDFELAFHHNSHMWCMWLTKVIYFSFALVVSDICFALIIEPNAILNTNQVPMEEGVSQMEDKLGICVWEMRICVWELGFCVWDLGICVWRTQRLGVEAGLLHLNETQKALTGVLARWECWCSDVSWHAPPSGRDEPSLHR